MIIRIENWNRRRELCKQYGFRAAIVFDHVPRTPTYGPAACDTRMRIKNWAGTRFGPPMTRNWSTEPQWLNTDSEWLAYRSDDSEYTVAFKDVKARDWCLLL
jgi:hypothetical protein